MPPPAPVLSVEVGEAKPNETAPRRCPGTEADLVSIPFPHEPTICTASHAFERACNKFPGRNFLGHRVRKADGSFGAYAFQTYSSCWAECAKIGVALRDMLELKSPSEPGEGQARLGVYSINRPEWTKILFAAFGQRIIVSPLYDTLGENAVKFIIEHAELTTVACEKKKMMNVAKGRSARLKNIVVWETISDEDRKAVEEFGLKLYSLSELVAFGARFNLDHARVHPHPSDWAYIMYTSGTTGDPKGVILTHCNFLASAGGVLNQARGKTLVQAGDVYISFLPLAHSFEACMQVCAVLVGCSIGFYSGDIKHLFSEDVMAGVPRVYARMYDKVVQGLEERGGVAMSLYEWGMTDRAWDPFVGLRRFFVNAFLFKKIQARFGGRFRLFAAGAAPLSPELHRFLQVVFNCPVVQGYGLTENACIAAAMPLGYDTPGTVGGPIPCVEIKLQDTEAYKSSDLYPASSRDFEAQVSFKGHFEAKLAGKQIPRGEVCLRGANVFEGYYKNEKDTAETKDEEGWLHTGDIGVWNQDGSLSIVDRKKNIFKLAQGEYVSPEAVEIAIGTSKWVLQVWVYGNSFENYPVVVCTPDIEVMRQWAQQAGREGTLADWVKDPEVKKMIFDDIIASGKAAKLRSFELPKKIAFETTLNNFGQGFTIEEDLLTPTLKLRRPQLLKKYQKAIDEMYEEIHQEDAAAKAGARV